MGNQGPRPFLNPGGCHLELGIKGLSVGFTGGSTHHKIFGRRRRQGLDQNICQGSDERGLKEIIATRLEK